MTGTRKATRDDVSFVARNLREADRREVLAVGFEEPAMGVVMSAHGSDVLEAVVLNGKVCGIFGVVIDTEGGGSVWMVATREIEKHSLAFLRRSRGVVGSLLARFKYLYCASDSRNALHHQWLKWCGFERLPDRDISHSGIPFHFFLCAPPPPSQAPKPV